HGHPRSGWVAWFRTPATWRKSAQSLPNGMNPHQTEVASEWKLRASPASLACKFRSLLQICKQMYNFLPRERLLEQVRLSLGSSPVTAVLGPRQAGKTWIAKFLNVPAENYFDLEDDVSLLRLEGGAQSVLDRLTGLVVIDEIQRRPHLFSA